MNDIFEEPCSLLAHPDMAGPGIASSISFLSSSRIRQWKPKDLTKKKKGKDYCYIDYDEANQIKDVMLSGQKCTPAAFGNSTFIDNVFEDNTLDNARTFPHNKCILEIDSSKVTSESSDTFWSRVSDLHCYGIKDQIYRENLVIKGEVAKNMSEVSRMTKLVAAQDMDILDKRKIVDELTRNIRLTIERISFLQKVSLDLFTQFDATKKAYASYQQTFNRDKSDNIEYIETKLSEIRKFETETEEFNKSIMELKKEIIEIFRKIEEAVRAHDSKFLDFEKKKAATVELTKKCVNAEIELRNCLKQDATMRNLLKTCISTTVTTNKNIKDLEKAYSSCEELRNICVTNLKTLIQSIKDVMVDFKYFHDKYVPCNNVLLPSCTSNKIKVDQLWNNEKQEHGNWKSLPHYSCANEKVEKEDSDAKWERNKTTCENTQRDKQQLYDKYISLLAMEYQHKINQIMACKLKKNEDEKAEKAEKK